MSSPTSRPSPGPIEKEPGGRWRRRTPRTSSRCGPSSSPWRGWGRSSRSSSSSSSEARPMIESLIPAASTYAADIDSVFTLIFILVGFWFVLTEGLFLWLIVRFRKRDGVAAEYITGELKSEKRWISIPHLLVLVCDVFIIVAAVRVWYDVKQHLPEAQATVRVVAQQWAWSFDHPGPDGKLDTADDIHMVDELHVENGKLYHFKLVSKDVLHSFSVPAFRLKQDVIPGREITGWFEPILPGV